MQPLAPPQRLGWLGQVNSSNKLSGVTASDGMINDPDNLLMDFDRQIAGSGGIESISANRTADGNLRVTIEGNVEAGRISQSGSDGAPIAPSFNNSSKLMRAAELGLDHHDWQRAHLWGPGFGDEAGAGIWYASTEVNQVLQNNITEGFVRDLSEAAQAEGGSVELTVSGERFGTDEVPDGQGAGEFLKEIRYEVTVRDADGNVKSEHAMEFGLNPPPDGSFRDWDADAASKSYLDQVMLEAADRAKARQGG